MALIDTWFPYNSNHTDLRNVLTFAEGLPERFEHLLSPTYSNIQASVDRAEILGISSFLLTEALREATEVLQSDLTEKRRRLNLDIPLDTGTTARQYQETLGNIGFTGSSLRLKVSILNHLWKKVLEQVDLFGQDFLDISQDEILKPFRKFLTYLNTLLGSLINFIPGLDPLKEFKDAMEALLGIAES